VRDGLSRHEAIHAVGWVLIDHMARAARTNQPVEREAYYRDIRELTEERWRAGFEEDDED
jgi:hypothetical protein